MTMIVADVHVHSSSAQQAALKVVLVHTKSKFSRLDVEPNSVPGNGSVIYICSL